MRKLVSIVPFLKYVADDVALRGSLGEGFTLNEAPMLMVDLGQKAESLPPPAEERPRMKLPDMVQAAAEKKIAAELKPISEKLTRLRATLDAYESRVKEHVEQRVSNAILVALDMQQLGTDDSFELATHDLRDAITLVAEMVGCTFEVEQVTVHPPEKIDVPEPTQPAPVVEVHIESPPVVAYPLASVLAAAEQLPTPPPSVPAPPSTPVPVTIRPPRKATPEDIAHAKRLIAEVEALRSEIKNQHPTRLFPLLQAIVAEIKMLLGRLPENNYLWERLGSTVSLVGALKVEGNVPDFIRGLAFHSQADWEALAFRHRRIVEKYDQDTDKAPNSSHQPKPKTVKAVAVAETNGKGQHQWPDLPKLRALTNPILLAGGLIIPEKIKSVRERFGLDVEWHEIDHDNPRASGQLILRVRAAKVGALILLEGVMRHGTYKPVVAACNIAGIPYAMGDKAGVASLQSALTELERQLSA
jgi:hypothetical protein